MTSVKSISLEYKGLRRIRYDLGLGYFADGGYVPARAQPKALKPSGKQYLFAIKIKMSIFNIHKM